MEIAFVILGIAALALVLYWQLVIAEGVYFGQAVVTFLYDVTATRYNSIKQFDTSVEDRFLGTPLVQALNMNRGALILDIGAGTGRLAHAVLGVPAFQGRVLGVDASMPMLMVAARSLAKHPTRVTLICRDAASLPLEPDSVGVVTCLEMLEFTRSPRQQLEEAFRVIGPGGLLLTTRRRGFDARLLPGKTFAPDQFEQLLASVGFGQIRQQIWQLDYDLYWALKPGMFQAGRTEPLELICCPICGQRAFNQLPQTLRCSNCLARFSVVDGVIDLR